MTDTLQNTLSAIEIVTHAPAQKSLIWLHGLGADGNDFAPIVPELHLPESLHVRFVFPHAPIMPVTINNGYKMRAWYDIYALDRIDNVDSGGISQSVASVHDLIEKEVARGVATQDIILGGFSQGAVIALTAGLCYPQPLAGVLALSGYLPQAEKVITAATSVNKTMPVFIAHGTEDTVVPYALGKSAYAALNQAEYSVTWRSYPMPHSVCAEEIMDISRWLQQTWSHGA